MKPEMQ